MTWDAIVGDDVREGRKQQWIKALQYVIFALSFDVDLCIKQITTSRQPTLL
jgi:hypothetical protein